MVSSSFDRRATCPAQPLQGWRTSIDLDWDGPIARAEQSDMVRGSCHVVSAQFAVEYVAHTDVCFLSGDEGCEITTTPPFGGVSVPAMQRIRGQITLSGAWLRPGRL